MQLFYQTPTPELKKSTNHFSNLGFKIYEVENGAIAYDAQCRFWIDTAATTRPGLCMIKEDWTTEKSEIEKLVKIVEKEGSYFFADPSGCWVELRQGAKLALDTNEVKCVLGNFAGLSLEMIDIGLSAKIWTSLGFEHKMGAVEKGWISYEDEYGNGMSLMAPFACPHLFLNPSLTYFNGADNLAIIQNIRDRQIPIMEEVTVFNKKGIVDNVILREPGGYGFFIFSD